MEREFRSMITGVTVISVVSVLLFSSVVFRPEYIIQIFNNSLVQVSMGISLLIGCASLIYMNIKRRQFIAEFESIVLDPVRKTDDGYSVRLESGEVIPVSNDELYPSENKLG